MDRRYHQNPPHPDLDDIIQAAVLPPRVERIDQVLAGRTRDLVVVLENLEDSHNLSAVLRSADGFGVQEVHVVETRGPLEISRKVTQGCHKWLELTRHEDPLSCLDRLHARGFQLWAAALDPHAIPLTSIDFSRPTALVFGNEREGLTPALASRCDGSYIIPMRGFSQSFNVSVAAAISLFYATLPREVCGGGVAGRLLPEDRDEIRRQWLSLSVKKGKRIERALEDREDGAGEPDW